MTETLVALGHEVTLFASGDSRTSATLVRCCDTALRLDAGCRDRVVYHTLQLEAVMREAAAFDVLHFHTDYLHFPFARRGATPMLTTLHGRLDLRDLQPLFREYHDVAVSSISESQRRPLPWLNWQGTVHHGLPEDLYEARPEPGRYLAFLGRFSPEKRFDRALDLARRTGLKLRVAAKADPSELDYFAEVIRPLLDDPLVEFLGEIGESEKDDFLGNALALIFPIDWPEPFGLVMIEAMACGTPVIAWRAGAVPELVDEEVTGFIVGSMKEAVEAVGRCASLDRRRCRDAFLQRFSARRMASDYLALYHALAHGPTPLRPVMDGPVG